MFQSCPEDKVYGKRLTISTWSRLGGVGYILLSAVSPTEWGPPGNRGYIEFYN